MTRLVDLLSDLACRCWDDYLEFLSGRSRRAGSWRSCRRSGRSLSTYLPITRDRVIFMVIGRANRRDTRAPRARELFGEDAEGPRSSRALGTCVARLLRRSQPCGRGNRGRLDCVGGTTPEARSGGETCGGGRAGPADE